MDSPKAADFEKIADKAEKELAADLKAERDAHKAELEYAQKHFFFVADQRLKAFHFHLIVLIAISAGLPTLLDLVDRAILFTAASVIIIISIAFRWSELRNKNLLRQIQVGLQKCEQAPFWSPHAQLSTREKAATDLVRERYKTLHWRTNFQLKLKAWWDKNSTFSAALTTVWILHFTLGASLLLGAVFAAHLPLLPKDRSTSAKSSSARLASDEAHQVKRRANKTAPKNKAKRPQREFRKSARLRDSA